MRTLASMPSGGSRGCGIALAANIVRDTQDAAEVKPETRRRYEALLRTTLDAFQPQSKVPKQTQLDLLEAFGKLGASVKGHLISATGSRLLDVRKRALRCWSTTCRTTTCSR